MMKKITFNKILLFFAPVILLFFFSRCSIGDLELQKNYQYHNAILDPHINMMCLKFMQSRNKPDGDSLFSMMLKAIEYTGLSQLYEDTGYTYFLLTDTAFTDPNQGYLHDKGVLAITELPVDTIKALLKYHIIKGKYTSLDLKQDIPIKVETLLSGEKGKMTLSRDEEFRIHVNDFSGSKRTEMTVTTNLLPTNGVINVLDQYAKYIP